MSVALSPQVSTTPASPLITLDTGHAVRRLYAFQAAFGASAVHYAVKANPHPTLLRRLARAGSRFDVASLAEVRLALAAGARAGELVYSNTMKGRVDVAAAHRLGVQLFAADSPGEIDKLADAAPGAAVLIRLAVNGAGSDWPLADKFGCQPEEAVELLVRAGRAGLRPAGVSFHVGSQQRDPSRWAPPVARAAEVFAAVRAVGLRPWLVDLGGGFPADHEGDQPAFAAYPAAIHRALADSFGADLPEILVEPGRGIVGDAGSLVSTVLGITWRAGRRWVYLDVGVYSGLIDTIEEAIRYRLSTDRRGPTGPAVLAGPTCDSWDVLYERTPVQLPLDLAEGDQVRFASAGAYTTSCATVGFNGFAPLPVVLR